MNDSSLFNVYVGDGKQRMQPAERLSPVPPLSVESGSYIADPSLVTAVNIALSVGQPLLVTGEPGCGKTRLAWSVAHELGLPEPLQFYTRSTSRAQDLLYQYDAIRRLYDVQLKSPRARSALPYIRWGPLGEAITSGKRHVVVIDEVDKAPRDFPNDLLFELDRMSFYVPELEHEEPFKSEARPIVIITSNSERQLPLPFLRRCVCHHIAFPGKEMLTRIIEERLRHAVKLDPGLVSSGIDAFQRLREVAGIQKPPATGELLTWMTALHRRGVSAPIMSDAPLSALPLMQALIKDRDDLLRLEAV